MIAGTTYMHFNYSFLSHFNHKAGQKWRQSSVDTCTSCRYNDHSLAALVTCSSSLGLHAGLPEASYRAYGSGVAAIVAIFGISVPLIAYLPTMAQVVTEAWQEAATQGMYSLLYEPNFRAGA